MSVAQERQELAKLLRGHLLASHTFDFGDHQIDLVNRSAFEPTTKHLRVMSDVMRRLNDFFPEIIRGTDTIVLESEDKPSVFGDDEMFPLSGEAYPQQRRISLFPRVFHDKFWRARDPSLPATPLLPGVLIHELTHNHLDPFTDLWGQNGFVEEEIGADYHQLNQGPYGVFDNGKRPLVGFEGRTMVDRENPTIYSLSSLPENICDCVTCFMLQPDYLRQVAPTKYRLLENLLPEQKAATVYFAPEISPASLIRIYQALGVELPGRVAVKISTGEPGGHNFLNPELIKDLVQGLSGTIVETNTAYQGQRSTTEDSLKAAFDHGFTQIAPVDILDADGDMALPVTVGKHLKKNYVGKHLSNYDSLVVLSHFKGHAMAGFGGALKNMAIGLASPRGKSLIHTGGAVADDAMRATPAYIFIESMAEADEAVMEYFPNIVYINVLNNLSVNCDCDPSPAKPCMRDIGIAASLDPVALDQACLDLVYNSSDEGRDQLVERIESQNGTYITRYAALDLGIGSLTYELEVL